MAEPGLLAIVPARGASKRVPYKNLRLLGDRPLVAYTVEAVSGAGVADRLIVSSDHEHVLRWAELHGHETHRRPAELAAEDATLDELALAVVDELGWEGDVGLFQPTSPFRTAAIVQRAVERFRACDAGSLSTCVREDRTYWIGDQASGRPRPLSADPHAAGVAHAAIVCETGAIQLVRSAALRETGQLITPSHELFELDPDDALEIRTNDDLVVARRRFEQGNVVFRLRANSKVGSGHMYHCLQLADELADQQLSFLLRDCDPFVYDVIADHGYSTRTEVDLAADLAELAAPGNNLIVNDVLDTHEREVLIERAAGWRVVNIEDLGPGARLADWVVNALYPVSNGAAAHVSWGPEYATLRSEFFHLPPKQVRERPERILITFGGTDPGQLGPRCARLLVDEVDAEIRAVVGPGSDAEGYPEGVSVAKHVRSMAAEMVAADLILTSAGRTVYEAAAVGTPVVVLAQNARDATHAHLDYQSGVVFLGIGPLVDDEHVVEVVKRLLADHNLRTEFSERLRRSIDAHGAARIGHRVRAMLRGF
jgi:CMP-N-acetylneuraminic acid synthetase/spore coat polysaccharide biosynthesis predicted glycosyltransferase SpsG